MKTVRPWSPLGFDNWREYYPATQFCLKPDKLDLGQQFAQCWEKPVPAWPRSTVIVLIAGLYSEWLHRCHQDGYDALKRQGYPVLRLQVRSSNGVMAQGELLAIQLNAVLAPGQRFVVLAHSKGGLDALATLQNHATLRHLCDGVALVQAPIGPSIIVDQILARNKHAAHNPNRRRADHLRRLMLRLPPVAAGTRDISSQRDPRVAAMLDALPPELHCIHVVSWSSRPSSRFDSHHARLNMSRPGYAHDGQFYLEHQALEEIPQLGLPHLDHAQPVLAGLGFDAGRFWLALAALLYSTRKTVSTP